MQSKGLLKQVVGWIGGIRQFSNSYYRRSTISQQELIDPPANNVTKHTFFPCAYEHSPRKTIAWVIKIRKLWYIYTMEYYSAVKKNTFESVLMKWINLEPIIQSEVSQKEKHQYSILTQIYGI